ncbi:hypothetical protein ACFVUS_07080 [Nocardia sp. NPDC058058]|uniref:hypothetical protein n=1 Tax=Nocardia sp. NPDC058058 TaxID=3346317 RepID=UPI0036D9A02A
MRRPFSAALFATAIMGVIAVPAAAAAPLELSQAPATTVANGSTSSGSAVLNELFGCVRDPNWPSQAICIPGMKLFQDLGWNFPTS